MSHALTFRIHFANGFTVDRTATSSAEARKPAQASYPHELITKIKRVREDQSASSTLSRRLPC